MAYLFNLDRYAVELVLLEKGWNHTDLSKHYGCTPSNIAQTLKAEQLSSKTLTRLAKALGVPPTQIIKH